MRYLFPIFFALLFLASAKAQEADSLSKLQSDIFILEEQISQLVGQQEQLQYELSKLQGASGGENDTANADILSRLEDIVKRLEALELAILSKDNAAVVEPEVEAETETVPEVSTQDVAVGLSDDDIKDLYEASFSLLARKQYDLAEQGFKDFLSEHGSHALAANASYWLAETYYVRKDYRVAATEFLRAYNDYPDSGKRFDALLKLSLSLRSLGADRQACKSLAELLDSGNDPNGLLSASTRRRAEREREELSC